MININDFTKIKVEQLENKNQFVIFYEKQNGYKVVVFQSYQTIIAVYDHETKQLLINWRFWDYSKTTMKHLKIFINRYTIIEYENKTQFTKEIINNSLISTFNN